MKPKKLLSLLLSLALVVGMIPAFGVVAQAEEIIQISWSQNEIRWTEVPETTHYSISLQWIAADGVHVGETMKLTFYPEGKKGSPDLMIDYDGHSYGMEG